MAFDKPTRNRLAKFVSDARGVIANEFTEQFQSLYGISAKGEITHLDKLAHLDEAGLATAALLRERIDYLEKTHPDDKEGTKAAVARLAREQAFTILNRLAAIRMAEKRGLILESVGQGYQSRGFKVFETVAGTALGDTYHRYRRYLFCLFDELAIDLGVLFDRRSPQALLFPREPALLALLDLVHAADLEPLWAEDETIGWIYQYYNDPEERKKMRKESAAPRNSRELAVRNQFFTPRYVVEFLTDNTLGRIWYEMTRGKTRLAEQCRYLVRRPTEIFLAEGETAPETPDRQGLSQAELLKQPDHIPYRPLKDPREIRLLDPACGSMHFGLYAFDLFETIYEEAWDNGSCPTLQDAYSSKDDFLKHIPRLIVEHNIHGIDIDPRAVQIAGLSLWLRAQKAWQASGVKPADRPRIRRSNIVCAEPMPGSPEMLKDFVATLAPPLLGELVKTVFDKMQLAGEAGSLLKIEEEIRTAIDTARKEWLKQQGDLFSRKDGSQEAFFDTAEQQVIDALRAYAEQAETDSYQRRLFADDAARGFAFIDLCRKRYDAVVMNPPFGEATISSTSGLRPYAIKNLYSCFVERAGEMSLPDGAFAAITDSTYLKQPTFVELRHMLLSGKQRLRQVVDLGWGVLDANVRTALFVCHRWNGQGFDSLDVADRDDRVDSILEASDRGLFVERSHEKTLRLPKSVLALNLPVESTGNLIALDRILSIAELPWGCGANDSVRLFRLRWEVANSEIGDTWAFLTNGGEFAPLYRENYFVCRVRVENGESAFTTRFKNDADFLYDASAQHLYYRAGLTYPKRTRFFHLAALPAGHVFTPEGKGFFPKDSRNRLHLLAILNSSVVVQLADFLCGPHKQRGDVEMIGVPRVDKATAGKIEHSARRALASLQSLAVANEDSALFYVPWRRNHDDEYRNSLKRLIEDRKGQIALSAQIVADAFQDFDAAGQEACPWLPLDENCVDELRNARNRICDSYALGTDAHVSYLLGCSFGRWDIRYATGERQGPELPDPFDPLPVCPPGMLQNAEGLPSDPKDVPADYPLRISWPGILVDDENHPEDIITRVREAIEVIWKDHAERIEQEACDILGVKTLRDYFRRPAAFFADHLKRYSKTRRQAPIYWPLSTKSGSYSLWLYYHRLTDQTLHACLADFLDPKIRKVQSEIDALTASGGGGTRAGELREFLDELHDLRDEIEHVIKLPWKPNLNDGVLIIASPLWKLFRLPTWQKDLKACWDKLADGAYEWAHIAYPIWPARVEKACEKDRSIAIAHDVEHLCAVEAPKPKRQRKQRQSSFDDGEE